MRVTTFQYEKSGKNHIICSVKTFSSMEHNLPVWEKKIIGTSSILAWVKVVCCLHYQVLHEKQPCRKLVSGFSFACNKYPLQFSDGKSNDSSMGEGMPLDAQARIHTGFHCFTKIGQSFHKELNFSWKKLFKLKSGQYPDWMTQKTSRGDFRE